jgi:hypothetical protein
MKYIIEKIKENKFEPIVITITIERKEELQDLVRALENTGNSLQALFEDLCLLK